MVRILLLLPELQQNKNRGPFVVIMKEFNLRWPTFFFVGELEFINVVFLLC